MHGTTTGLESPERPDGPLFENSSDTARCACGDPLDGFDARRDEATCGACARLRADGGHEAPSDSLQEFLASPETEASIVIARHETGHLATFATGGDESGETEAELIASHVDAMSQRTDLSREEILRLIVAKLNEIPKGGWDFEDE